MVDTNQRSGGSKQPSVEKVQTKNNTYTPKDAMRIYNIIV